MTPDTPLYNSLNEPYLIIVDDDPDDLDLIKEIYSEIKLDHRVKFLNSGEALLDLLESIDNPSDMPSLIVLDYNMPRLSGSSVLMLLKENKRYRHIPIAIYSTSLPYDMEKELLLLGATYCRKKRASHEGIRQLLIEFVSMADISHQNMAFLSEK